MQHAIGLEKEQHHTNLQERLKMRPIELSSNKPYLCCLQGFGKKLLRNRIMSHMEGKNCLTHQQHGFHSNRSNLTQLLEYLHYVEEVMDDGGCIDVVNLDFSKALES